MTRLGSTVRRSVVAVPVALALILGSAIAASGAPEEPTPTTSPTATETETADGRAPDGPTPDGPTPDDATPDDATPDATATPDPTVVPPPAEPGDAQSQDSGEDASSPAPADDPSSASPEAPAAPEVDADDDLADAQVQADPAEYTYWALPYGRYLYTISQRGALVRALSLADSAAFLAAHPDQVGDTFAVGAVTFVSSPLETGDHYARVDASVLGGEGVTTTLLTTAQIALARERLGSAYVVRTRAHIPGTRYLHYSTAANPSEVIALLPTGTRVKMTAAQYAAAGSPAVEVSLLEFYTVPWNTDYVWKVSSQTGSRTRLTTAQWRSEYAAPGAATARMVITKVSWDASLYVFVFMGDSNRWVRWLTNDAMKSAIRAADPQAWRDVRVVAQIPGSSYYQWEYAHTEKFVRTPDGDVHKLTSGQYAAAGSPRLRTWAGYIVRPAWSSTLWWFRSPTSSSGAHLIAASRYRELDEPTPRVWSRLPGDSFYRWQGVSTIYWRLKGHVESLSTSEHAQAGRPALGLKLRPRGGYGGSYGHNATPGTNGSVPASDLCVIPFLTTHKIRCGTLPDLLAFNDAYYARFGTNLPIDTWRYSTFRSYRDQVAVWNEIGPPNAARPGTSPHGYGLAVDFVERYGFSTVQNRWLAANGPTYHWVRQPWHNQGGSWGEWWHFDYIG